MTVNENEAVFSLGMYDQPRDAGEWSQWRESGINLLHCGNEEDLDKTRRAGMMGWVSVPIICRNSDDEEILGERIRSLRDHPALVAWEAQDEAIWNACRLENGVVTNSIWAQPPEIRKEIRRRLDDLVEGLRKGSSMVRELDPARKFWLNEAAKSDQETLARCLPYLDIVSYDYYPLPEHPENGRQMKMLGGFTDRFRRTALSKDLWVVEQAFSWRDLSKVSFDGKDMIHEYNSNTWLPATEEDSGALPGVEEFRFMAWISICHGANGLLWFGSRFLENRSEMLDGLMTVVQELHELQPFLDAGNINTVQAITHERRCPSVSGISSVARRNGDGTLLALVNEDYTGHDVTVTGMDWVEAADLVPMFEPSDGLRDSGDGLVTAMEGQEVRLYLAR